MVPVHLVGYFDAVGAGLRTLANPEVGIGTSAIVVKIGDVEGLLIQDRDVIATQSVGESIKFRQYFWHWHSDVARHHYGSQIKLEQKEKFISILNTFFELLK